MGSDQTEQNEIANFLASADGFLKAGQPGIAERVYRQAVEKYPQSPRPLINLARLLATQSNHQEAAGFMRRALAMEPSATGYYMLAEVLQRAGDIEGAKAAARECLSLEPKFAQATSLLATFLEEEGRFDEVRDVFQGAILAGVDPGIFYYRYVRAEKVTEADTWFLDRLAAAVTEGNRSGEDARYVHYAQGKAYDDLGKYGSAMAAFDLANAISRATPGLTKHFDERQYRSTFDQLAKTYRKGVSTATPSDSEKPVLVVGMPRSGTTLTEQILSAHPEIGGAGEVQFWLEPEARRIRLAVEAGQSTEVEFLTKKYLALLGKAQPGKRLVVDKMPNNYIVSGFVHAVFPKAKIIHVKRDLADTGLSLYMTPYRDAPRYAYAQEKIVFALREYERLMGVYRDILPASCFLEVEYERLVRQPERVIREMLSFLGVEWSEACMKPEENTRLLKTQSLWQVRQPMNQRAIGRAEKYRPWLGALKELLPPEGDAR